MAARKVARTRKGKTRITNEHSAGVLAFEFYGKILEFQKAKETFERYKKRVNACFEEYFQACGTKKMCFVNDDSLQGGMVTVTRVQKSKITWDVAKLKKQLSRDVFNQIVRKQYQVIDMQGLIVYLKTCGVDAKKFRTFINVSMSVDESELDRLSDIGEVTKDDIEGCYTISKSNPYFKYSYKAGDDE